MALFMGNGTPTKDVYIFQQPVYESHAACLEAIAEHYDALNYYLSQQFDHPTEMYHNGFFCATAEDVKKLIELEKETKTDVSI